MELFIAMLGAVIILIWCGKGSKPDTESAKQVALKAESGHSPAITAKDIRLCFTAQCATATINKGFHSGFSRRAHAVVIAFDQAVYICTPIETVRLSMAEISECVIKHPDTPYVMNINAAALVTNQLVRMEVQQLVAVALVTNITPDTDKIIRLDHCETGFAPEIFTDFVSARIDPIS